jgi:hypothetical protein
MNVAAALERSAAPSSAVAAELDAAFAARADARRQRDAEDAARRLAVMRAGKAAQSNALIAMPRMAALMKAGALLGSAQALADALGIKPRSLRAKTGAERGVSNEDLRKAADALDIRAALLTQHAQKLREEAGA